MVQGPHTKDTFIRFLWTTLYSRESNPLHLYIYLFTSPEAILVCRIPSGGKCIKQLYLLVLDWCWCARTVHWMWGWRMDHQWMSIMGILTHNCLSHVQLEESIKQKVSAIWEYSYLPHRLRLCVCSGICTSVACFIWLWNVIDSHCMFTLQVSIICTQVRQMGL